MKKKLVLDSEDITVTIDKSNRCDFCTEIGRVLARMVFRICEDCALQASALLAANTVDSDE